MYRLGVPIYGYPTRNTEGDLFGERRYMAVGPMVDVVKRSRGRRLVRGVVERQIVYAWVDADALDKVVRKRRPVEGC